MKKKIFIWLFALLYVATGFVSTWHAVALFSLANPTWIAVILAVVFEIGQAAVLFSILTVSQSERHWIQWVLMIILTVVQVMGNVYSSFSYIELYGGEGSMNFTKSILFQSPEDPLFNPTTQNIFISYIIGAILPVVALLLTSIVARLTTNTDKGQVSEQNNKADPINSPAETVILDKEKEDSRPSKPVMNKVII